ncbi:MAG: aryl-sulfate sulfotransferase [Chloroflexi bacterium]|nr:aryl-sulfate sulfotransferase [Chloroflexota bacterium]
MPIDQQTRQRMSKTGLTALDRDRACPGFVLYCPMGGSGDVYLVNLDGEEVHHWTMPHPPGLYGYLLPNGNLFYGGKIRDDTWDRFPSWKRFKGGVMLEATPAGEIVWEHHDRDHHHDARRTESGGALYLTVEEVPRDLAAKVKGGVPGPDGGAMWADVIVEVDAAGDRVWEWHAAEHLDAETDVITFNDHRAEWSHGNTVVPLPDGRVMFSFRNISTVGIIDKASNEIVWRLGYETLAQQHDPSMLPNGNILIFDNGSHRREEPLPSSRVIEIDPNSNRTVWEYRDRPAYNFFSPYISGARRLGNGNTLITEGMFGRMFQVTPQGEVVWEYINPHFFTDVENLVVNRVFRATHYMPGEIPWL